MLHFGLTEVGCEGHASCNCWRSDGEHILCIDHQLCRYSKQHHLSHGCWRVANRTMSKGFICSILLDFNSVVGHLEGTDIRRLKTNKQTNKQANKQTNKQKMVSWHLHKIFWTTVLIDHNRFTSDFLSKILLLLTGACGSWRCLVMAYFTHTSVFE